MKLLKEDIYLAKGGQIKHNLIGGGSKLTIPKDSIIFRPPTKQEIQAADTNPSDYQIAQLRILSKILFDFGLASQVYRSKSASIVKSNVKQIEKYKQIFRIFLQGFNSNEPIKNVRNLLTLVSDDIFEVSDLITVLNATKDWSSENELLMNLASMYRSINQYDKNAEPSKSDVKAVRQVYNKLSDFLQSAQKASRSPREIKKALTYANTINNLMAEHDLQGANELVYKDTAVKTVSDLEADIDQYLTSQMQEGKTGHANTILHEEARENLQKLAAKLKNDGYKGGLTTKNVFDYMKANEPETIQYISNAYNIPENDLSGEHFPTWESLAKFFYSPENIRHIEFDQLQVVQRARTTGDSRKGALLAVDAKTIAKRKERLKRQVEENPGTASVANAEDKLEAKEREYEEAKEIRDKAKADLIQAKNSGKKKSEINKLATKYEEIKALTFKIGKQVSAIRHAIKVAAQSPKKDQIKKSNLEQIKDLEQEEQAVYNKARKHMGDDEDIREFEANYQQEEQVKDGWFFDDDSELKYKTWHFVVNTTNSEVTDYIVALLKKGLKQIGKFVNVDKFEPEYQELDGTEIIIDYPEECKLTELFKKNPDLAYQIMDSCMFSVNKKFPNEPEPVSYYDDEKYIKINKKF